ncbi:MAG TPA: hypothetical protein PKW90_26750, partial [Myxococcota bacterium]|nr:hypothetical protein [Myxococcota bacterium]
LVRRLSGAELPILDVGLWLAMVVSGITALYRDAQKKPDDRPQPMFVFHPYYLVQVLADRLYLWPWLHLSDINIVRNNSQFTLTLLFGNRGASWVVWSEEQARRWAGQVSFHRRQLLEALTSGVLDAVPGVDFAPPSRLPTRPELPSGRSPLVGVVVVAILLGLVAAGVTLYQTRWQRVVGADTVDAYQGWADGAATPAQRELALARSAALEQDAKEFFLQTVDPTHPGIVGLLAAAEVLPPGRVLPIVDELRGESYLEELSYILELRGNYLRLAPIPVTQSREKLPAWIVLTRQDDREKVEIFVGGKPVFEQGLTSTAPSRAGRLAEALGLGRLPSAQRWVRFRSSSKNPYALGKKVSGGAR